MESVNVLIDKLLNKKTGKMYCKVCYDDDSYLMNCYQKDFVEEEKILALLKKGHNNFKMQWVFLNILFYIEPCCITDRIVDKCLHYHGKFKETLLTQLAHLRLTLKQLMAIHKERKIPEAFYQVFLIMLYSDEYSENDLTAWIMENRENIKKMEDYKTRLKEKSIDPEKIRRVDELLKNYPITKNRDSWLSDEEQ